jgi:hypothetical protein
MKLGMGGNISFKLVPIVENQFPGFSREISFCADEKIGLLNDDFKIHKIIGPDEIPISPRFIHGMLPVLGLHYNIRQKKVSNELEGTRCPERYSI